jgi:hydrogenase-4 component F
MMLLSLLLIPLAASGLIAIARRRALMELLHAVAAMATLGAGTAIVAQVWNGAVLTAAGDLFRVDALSSLMVAIITFLGAIAALYAVGYIRAELDDAHLSRIRLFFTLFHLFIFTMLVAVTTDNLGVMWIAVEGTTLATVFLVNLRQTPPHQAKILDLVVRGHRARLHRHRADVLRGARGRRNPSIERCAPRRGRSMPCGAAGRVHRHWPGTKGLAPMHTWLPDAHSEAPAPISALMSGVLLNVGLYAMIRFKTVVDAAVGPEFAARLLIGLGLFSVLVAAAFLVRQRNYKRMLAYSSVEHIGIICLGLGFGGYWGVFGALLHIVNHALSKSLLFILSGNILLKYHSAEIIEVRGLLRASPWTGGLFLAGTFALIGLPPFAPFISEFIIFRAGLESHPWAAGQAWSCWSSCSGECWRA